MGRPLDGLIKVAVVENNRWAFASEFKGDNFQVGSSRGFQDFPANQSAASKGNLRNIHVLANGLADRHAWVR